MLLLDLPEDVWRHISLHLSAPDILNFLCVHPSIHSSLSKSDVFWTLLFERDCDPKCFEGNNTNIISTCTAQEARQAYMIQAYKTHLPSLKWYPVRRTYNSGVSPREGHLACVLKGRNNDHHGESRICIQGGYTDDDSVHVIHVPKRSHDDQSAWTWSRLRPTGGVRPSFVYGASWTALDESRAVRFGGFQSGGYSSECNQVIVMTLKDETTESGSRKLSAVWEEPPIQNSTFAAARAYQSSTLVAGRYLVVIGGMMRRESILGEAILDTQTWTWFDQSISSAADEEKPSGRHGHSVILDHRRNRLVLFGGGNGTDLLRSGKDNSEVWELKMGDGWSNNLAESLPWKWCKIHADSEGEDNEDDTEDQLEEPLLSPAETLCLGRCHQCVKASPDTALLLFGSGRPSTNGVLGYNLQADSFIRPKIQGPLPKPRFTGVAALLEREGYLFVHGGYTSQESDAIGDMSILDLAPALGRDFNGLPVDRNQRCYGDITDDEAQKGRQNRDAMLHRMLETMTNAQEDERQGMAAQMLGQMIATNEMGDRSFMLMNMIANRAAVLRTAGETEEDEEQSDEDDSDSDFEEDNEMAGL